MSCRALGLAVLGIVLSSPLGAAEPSCPQGDTITGTARAIDGDTLEVRSMTIRLQGVAAPELDEPGGAAAAAAMREIVERQQVHCLLDGTSTHGRCVASCYIGALDIGWEIIRQGYARDCPRFSGFRYLDAELAAPGGMALARTYTLPAYCRP
jgi:micrococcal nuclease